MNEGETERWQRSQEVNYKSDGKVMDNQEDTKRRGLVKFYSPESLILLHFTRVS